MDADGSMGDDCYERWGGLLPAKLCIFHKNPRLTLIALA